MATEPQTTTNQGPMSKWLHALWMAIILPGLALVAAALYSGVWKSPANFLEVLTIWAFWTGVVGIGVIAGWVGLVFANRDRAWALAALVTGILAFLYIQGSGSRTGETSSVVRDAISTRTAKPLKQPSEDAALVNEAVENIPPTMDIVLDAETVRRFEGFMVDHVQASMAFIRAQDGRASERPPELSATTTRVDAEGHVVYSTEIWNDADKNVRVFVLWNVHEGQFKRVQCMYVGDTFWWRKGNCGAQLSRTFGWAGWHDAS